MDLTLTCKMYFFLHFATIQMTPHTNVVAPFSFNEAPSPFMFRVQLHANPDSLFP